MGARKSIGRTRRGPTSDALISAWNKMIVDEMMGLCWEAHDRRIAGLLSKGGHANKVASVKLIEDEE